MNIEQEDKILNTCKSLSEVKRLAMIMNVPVEAALDLYRRRKLKIGDDESEKKECATNTADSAS